MERFLYSVSTFLKLLPWLLLLNLSQSHGRSSVGEQPLSKINILNASLAVQQGASIRADPFILGRQNEDTEWVTVNLQSPNASTNDWVGVFSPARFNDSNCDPGFFDIRFQMPYICSAPIKYQFVYTGDPNYVKTGIATLKFQLINQRADFSFALFSGGLPQPKLLAISNIIAFANPKAPLYPRLALGKSWDEMTVTWTSGYSHDEATPMVEWQQPAYNAEVASAVTLTFTRESMCGAPARTVGWRDPGFIHTAFLRDLWPNQQYSYRLGHRFPNGDVVWSNNVYRFTAPPSPGQNSVQSVVIFGDMGKAERDGSNEFNEFQPGSLNTTDQLIKELELGSYQLVFHIGDICYANGYLSQWDQFTAQVQSISSTVPYMISSGNHERDYPDSGSFYNQEDSGGECGVVAQNMFHMPAENRAKLWYKVDYGLFRFCIADSEHDWREGSEQHKFIENCFATVDRQKQPWLIFSAHRVLGYSSNVDYASEGSFEEPMGRVSLEKLWQKYRVDLAIYGHVHNYERSCPVYQNQCVKKEQNEYSGKASGTIHVVAGGGGAMLDSFSSVKTRWSLMRDIDYGFVHLTAFNQSSLLFEYKKSSDGITHDWFTIKRDYRDVLACVHDGCAPTTLAE